MSTPTLSAPPFLANLQCRVPCADRPGLFHPPDDGYGDLGERGRQRRDAAIVLCGTCPIKRECRDWARASGEFGIWGGETDEDRSAADVPSRVRGVKRCHEDMAHPADPAPGRVKKTPYLTAGEEIVLDCLRAGIAIKDIGTQVRRSPRAVIRAINGLRRKLHTDTAGIVTAARLAGVFSTSHDTAA